MSDEIVKEFLIESSENLDKLDRELVALEKNPNDAVIIGSIFRTIHTIKGTCGFLGFEKLESITHVGENLLDKVRSGKIHLSGEITSALLALLDAIRKIMAAIESTGTEGDGDYTALVRLLSELNEGKTASDMPVPDEGTEIAAPAADTAPEPPPPSAAAEVDEVQEPQRAKTPPELPHMQTALQEPSPSADTTTLTESEPTPITEPGNKPMEHIESVKSPGEDAPATPAGGDKGVADTSLRVDVQLLDQLMNLVGELVLARNQILQFSSNISDAAFQRTTQRLNLITSELQEQVMKTRMQPIANVWNKFPRIIRDLARTCNKQVRLEMEGKETDLDKTLIEAIKDPLTHIVRNSVDHGVELPDARIAAGKNPEGLLLLRAFHEGGQVIIEISDDGAGLDADKLKKKAIERGILTVERAARMSDAEAFNLIFAPGFSTAEKITNISGRGVGMDVVRTNIEKIGGAIDLQSKKGKGTTITLKIPLTLAIIPALVVMSSEHRFAIPQVSLVELVRIEGAQIKREIERIDNSVFYRLRGNLLPLVNLNGIMRLDARAQVTGDNEDDVMNIVVLKSEDRQFGLVVDTVNDTEEIVVKPLGKQLKDVEVFAGATIMGDGRVALILDVLGLAKQANIVSAGADAPITSKDQATEESANNKQALLLVRVDGHDRMAIPLAMVDRLEEFEATTIEHASGRDVVQYRGGILPLVDLARHFTPQTSGRNDLCQVIVHSCGQRSVGLMVQQILDIVEEDLVIQHREQADGICGSAIIQKKVTDILDIRQILERTDPGFYGTAPKQD